jgi:hypothetical protein
MSNRGGKSPQHGLVGINPPHSAQYKRTNKAKAKARKASALEVFMSHSRGV